MRIIILFISAFLITSCSGEADLKSYYYNLQNYTEAQVYVYAPERGNNKDLVWYWHVVSDTSDNTLITTGYDSDHNPTETFVEQFGNDGATLVRFDLYDEDGNKVISKPIEKDVYQWADNGPYSYKVKFEDDAVSEFHKEREFVDFEYVDVMGLNLEAAKFKSIFHNKYPDREDYEFTQYEWYTGAYGLVRTEQHADGDTTVWILKEVLDEWEWTMRTSDEFVLPFF